MTTLRDLMNLPSAIESQLEQRSSMRANALAHRIVNKITGSTMQADPYQYNPYQNNQPTNGAVRLSQHINETPRGKK
jgi:hypothetical protein